MSDELKQAIHGKVNIQIGKNGLSDSVIAQIKAQLKKNKFLKIRFLEVELFETINKASLLLEEKTGTRLEDIRGNTCVIRRLTTSK